MNVFERAAQTWRSRSVPLLPPAEEGEIATVFAGLRCPLSQDVRSLYAVTGGFKDWACDGLWSLWDLARIRKENEEDRRESFVRFSDFSIMSHAYCFHYENEQTSSVHIDDFDPKSPPRLIAGSVAEFLGKLLDQPATVEAWNV